MQSHHLQGAVSDAARAEELDRCEESHWWYAGLRDLLARIVRSRRFHVPYGGAVLDVGCGAGGNLRLLADLLQPNYLGGFDMNEHCLTAARRKCPSADLYLSDLRRPQFNRTQYDFIICCDVLCAAGLDRCGDGLAKLAERLTPRGRAVFHLPAYPWLFGEHDIAVGNIERYRIDEIRAALTQAGWTIELLTHRQCLAFPAVATARLLRRRCPTARTAAAPQSDLQRSQHGGLWLRNLAAFENGALCRGFNWPFGTSLVAVARRA